MTSLGIGPEARRRLSARRTAEIVADELRRQIIDGELSDGDLLPRQEVLVSQFSVSLVSLREALRILETEGLVSVRRGNRGGAVVHAPAKASAAYMLGLMLQPLPGGGDSGVCRGVRGLGGAGCSCLTPCRRAWRVPTNQTTP